MINTNLKPVAWITGAGGLIGNYFVHTASSCAQNFRIIGLTRQQLDLTDLASVTKKFRNEKPSLVIHCAAMSSTIEAEKNPTLANMLNVEVTKNLAKLAADIPFVFFSTDLVFDGSDGNYDEDSPTNPLSVYGETKVAAEKIVLANPKHTVIRTSLNVGVSPMGDRSFSEQHRRAWQRGETLKLFVDEFRCPIPARVTARAVWELLAQNKPGLYHIAGGERLSRFQIGQLLAARHPELNPRIEPETLRSYHGAPRSPDTSLNCAKAQKLLSFPLPALSQWFKENPNEPF